MIHSGAIIGAGIPQFKSMFCKWLKLPYPYFRSDRYFASPSPNFTLQTSHMHTHHYHQSSHPTFHYPLSHPPPTHPPPTHPPLSHTPPTHPPLVCCRDKRDFVSSGAAAGVAGMYVEPSLVPRFPLACWFQYNTQKWEDTAKNDHWPLFCFCEREEQKTGETWE